MRLKYIFYIAIGFISCTKPAEKSAGKNFEDIKGFFQKEITRLAKANKPIQKTVSSNNGNESKTISNINWENELTLFIESDINKPAWKNSYKVINDLNQITYIALDSNLHTRQILIRKDLEGHINHIDILNRTENILYQSQEHLSYIPDSIYQIDKKQHTLLIGNSRYVIIGKIN